MNRPSICIVIVNWNSGDLLDACVSSLVCADFSAYSKSSLIVVDNNSEDGSADFLDEITECSIDIYPLGLTENLGFGRGCNRGFEHYLEDNEVPDLVLFLNPDCQVREKTFQILLEQSALDRPDVGIFGVQLVDDNGIATSCSNFPSVQNYYLKTLGLSKLAARFEIFEHHLLSFDHQSNRLVDQVMGAFFLVRGHVFSELSGFDEQFFVYFEEVDFSLRANKAGYASMFLVPPTIYHQGCGTTETVKAFRLYLSLSSRIKYFKKNASTLQYFAIIILTFFIEPIVRMGFSLVSRSSRAIEVLQAYFLILRNGLK
ncbi:MAG: glycosyltransferase family 2 protein [Halioglobus sp.]